MALGVPGAATARSGRKRRSDEFHGLFSRSHAMRDVFETCRKVGPTQAPVLVLGETGTGKELIARAIHAESGRSGPFVPVNCGGLPEGLVEAELFGHVKGSFTGADRDKPGLFRQAKGGTLFLDEIGNLPGPAQHSLLRTLQERTVRPVGGSDEVAFDARVIAATSNDLAEAVRAKAFREDLLYRLDVIRLVLPPLRERSEDLLWLFGHFLRSLSREHLTERPQPTELFLDLLLAHDWPGNVRELENFCERLVLTCRGQKLGEHDFRQLLPRYRPCRTRSGSERSAAATEDDDPPEQALLGRPLSRFVDTDHSLRACLEPIVDAVEKTYLERSLRDHHGVIKRCAAAAGMSRRTLLRKLKRLEIDKHECRGW